MNTVPRVKSQRAPYRSVSRPNSGPAAAAPTVPKEIAAEMAVRDQPCSRESGSTNAEKVETA
jgi:hypothetical protein